MGCAFCASTIGGKVRDLRASEMLDEVIRTGLEAQAEISNIVLMGIGEPLDNFDNVMRFLKLVNDPQGANIGMRHISLSTCGLVEGIDKLAELTLQLTLSVSLHAPDDETRSQLMPVNRAYGVEELYQACERYYRKTGRRISFEYAMVKDVNDTPYHAQLLAQKVKGMGAHVNLIRLNYVSERGLQPSTEERVREFTKSLSDRGVTVTVRRRLGSDIDAACGQLRRGQMRTP
jgi:23S rRNA (adenine2503-C2)-methyltransferase